LKSGERKLPRIRVGIEGGIRFVRIKKQGVKGFLMIGFEKVNIDCDLLSTE
jgi:hypothetical protein